VLYKITKTVLGKHLNKTKGSKTHLLNFILVISINQLENSKTNLLLTFMNDMLLLTVVSKKFRVIYFIRLIY